MAAGRGSSYHKCRSSTRYHPVLSVEQIMNRAHPWLLGAFLLVGPAGAVEPVQSKKDIIRLAVVITPESSGLLRQLLVDFEKQTGHKVAVDSRQDVFGLARDGKADLVLAHYGHRGTEEFCGDGLGLWPRPVFSNQAALIGPSSDQAKVAGSRDAVDAFRRIARAKAAFVVNNGPSQKYLADVLWQAAGSVSISAARLPRQQPGCCFEQPGC